MTQAATTTVRPSAMSATVRGSAGCAPVRPLLPRRCGSGGRAGGAARVTPAEHAAWQDKAAAGGVSPSALLRQAMARTRTRTARALAIERERTRQIARIGNKRNKLARVAGL